MTPETKLMEQVAPYQPWLIIAGVFVLFILLRMTRKALRRRVDEFGYRTMREKGLLIWFWLNAPGVIVHELSHALVVLLFAPFGFRITSVTLFRIRPMGQRVGNGRVVRRNGPQSLQLGEVQYVRPQGRFMSYVGDGFSGVAPLFGGTAAFMFLYWVATGYTIWDIPFDVAHQQWQIIRAGWPLWTLIFAPYLILSVTSELWPSHQDWHGARWFVLTLAALATLFVIVVWYTQRFDDLLAVATFISSRIDFALSVLLVLDLVFLIIAEGLVRMVRY
ncbi:hypothetical protein [Dictyobacter aurantiacus]|uniref:Uncharacterized protein n=1 Tax=Dictyobacter aurantiacus TaxID=1936993 RepID=A0A401ZHC3_9CHLR|nr:hypothetical protein [Dictyobacter aurantiacus]GCE06280.1 hypothetical protein KDAU_36090 [Dictyobacter aurantiacus]